MDKTLYCIRHGYALHNKLFWSIGTRAYQEFRDTPLIERGYYQAKHLNKNCKELDDIELVLTSPLTRTIQTSIFAFKDKQIPIIAKDFLIEHPIGNTEICNKRKEIEDLKTIYPYINFEIEDNIYNWPENEESINQLQERIKKLIQYIHTRKEKNIAIVGHSSYLSQLLYNDIGDEENDLKHCIPYKINLKDL